MADSNQEDLVKKLKDMKFEKLFDNESEEEAKPLGFELSCEEVQKQLGTYFNTPEKLSKLSTWQISTHLLKCRDCQRIFVSIKEK